MPGSDVGSEVISNNFKFSYNTPAYTALSGYHELNAKWALLGTLDYTQWSQQKHVNLLNVALAGPSSIDINIPENYNDTWRLALGTNYKLNDTWLLRAGVAFDQDPSNSTDRSANDPGSGSTSVAVGAHYQGWKTVGIDMGYEHFFMRSSTINLVDPAGSQHGTDQLHQDSIGAQVTWDLV